MKYSAASLLWQGLRAQAGWPAVWRNAEPKAKYDVIIVGGGGHGLATAYYLAAVHGIANVAVLERGWIGGGNVARNTTIIRSNYLLGPNARFYDFSLKLWEGLSQTLNYNVMFSQRGVLNTAHSGSQMRAYTQRGNAMRLNGIDAELLDREQVRSRVPLLDFSDSARFPIVGGLFQARGGIARHDAVAWGYARAASGLGVDIVQNCEVNGIVVSQGRAVGVKTTRGTIAADKIAIAVAGHTSQLASMVDITLPIETRLLQAWVSEPFKPMLDVVLSLGAGRFYVSQSDKGELVMGGHVDPYNYYGNRSNPENVRQSLAVAVTVMPRLSRLRMLRQWTGVVDLSMDGAPIISKTPVRQFYINGGWCTGGFKATPASGWCFAHTIANNQPHELNAPFDIGRFHNGRMIDESGAGPVPGAR